MDQEVIDDSFRFEKEEIEIKQKEKEKEEKYVGKEKRRRVIK